MVSLFGWEIKRPKPEQQQQQKLESFAPDIKDDGAVVVAAGGTYGTYVDLDGTIKSEAELISRYREMALQAEMDTAIDDVVNEAIVVEDNEKTVTINLGDVKTIGAGTIKKIEQEFDQSLQLLEFNTRCYEIFRKWYVDGRLYYHAIVDKEKPTEGIKTLQYLDPRKIRKVREIKKKKESNPSAAPIPKTVSEYFFYSDRGFDNNTKPGIPSVQTQQQGVKIATGSIVHCSSGLQDIRSTMVLSHLHKAIKPLNQLRALEDATLIYRISRAPERRIFYIDVGNLPKAKAEQYLRDMMTRYKNRLVYDATTGEIRDDRKFMTMLEDFWLPRREGGKGTEISTLPAGQNLGELEDVKYFQRKLYKSLNVPVSRLEPETAYMTGRSTEISRDELKFAKFVDRLRTRFSMLFLQILEKQLILKRIITPEEWLAIKHNIKFNFNRDNYWDELKLGEILGERLAKQQLADPYVGKYYSNNWVRKHILKQTAEEMEEIDQEIIAEMDDPKYNPPEVNPELQAAQNTGPDNTPQFGGPPSAANKPAAGPPSKKPNK